SLLGRGLPLLILALVNGPVALVAVWRSRPRIARFAVVAQVTFVLWAWAVGQWPYLVPPDITIQDAAAPVATLTALLVVIRIGMSGGLFVRAPARETGRELSAGEADRLRKLHEEAYARQVQEVKPLPGAQRLLEVLTDLGVPWAIATSSSDVTATASLTMLEVPPDVPVITRDKVAYAKPNPDL